MENKDILIMYKQVFNTAAGKVLIDFLKKQYIHGSVVASSPEITYYNLGKKEFVEEIILFTEAELKDFEQTIDIGEYDND